MDCSPLGSSVHGILQTRILEWVAIPFSRGSSWPRNQIWVSCTAGKFFTVGATREAPVPKRQAWRTKTVHRMGEKRTCITKLLTPGKKREPLSIFHKQNLFNMLTFPITLEEVSVASKFWKILESFHYRDICCSGDSSELGVVASSQLHFPHCIHLMWPILGKICSTFPGGLTGRGLFRCWQYSVSWFLVGITWWVHFTCFFCMCHTGTKCWKGFVSNIKGGNIFLSSCDFHNAS